MPNRTPFVLPGEPLGWEELAMTTRTEAPDDQENLGRELHRAGINRRRLLGWAAGVTAALALPPALAPQLVRAVTTSKKPTVLWLEFQNCTGDTESFLRSRSPGVGEIILDLVSLDYHETLMAPAGSRAEKSLTDAIRAGGHILVVEGSVPLADDGVYCVVGGRTAAQQLKDAAKGAAAVICVGTCSAHGGLPAAAPNPTGAVGVSDVVKGVPIINLPGCPVNVDNITATIVHYLTFKELPATDAKGRPLFAYGQKIHDNCPRRGHYEAGHFALRYGDEGHRAGWCLYKLGCKGPWTFHNCPTQQWNGRTQWPIGVGARCIGCSENKFWDLTFPAGGHASTPTTTTSPTPTTAPSTPATPTTAPSAPATGGAKPGKPAQPPRRKHGDDEHRGAIERTAQALGLPPGNEAAILVAAATGAATVGAAARQVVRPRRRAAAGTGSGLGPRV
ncbi:MAG TPA: hydrogenase small subunit, partial [Kineosporiaceae bacterium]|nr:hydrogenase small subunit [Kineosporiaceae bacterium]